MALLNFQKRFVPPIERGDKTHTIRGDRKYPIVAGETLHLYTGLRQKGARLLMRVPCTRVERITIGVTPDLDLAKLFKLPIPMMGTAAIARVPVEIDGIALDASERESLAVRDGFDGWTSMLAFWDGRLPFYGQIIHWRFPESAYLKGSPCTS